MNLTIVASSFQALKDLRVTGVLRVFHIARDQYLRDFP